MEFVLRNWNVRDVDDLAKAADNPRIAANLRNVFPSPYTCADARWYIDDCLSKTGRRQICHAIEVNKKAAGSIGIFVKDDVYEKSAELGYWLQEDYWRQGIMSQAVGMICREAFSTFDIIRIYAEPFASNKGSRGVLEKAGFTLEGLMRNGIYKNGRIDSYCIYSLLREECKL
ncbi:MAG: GNAT family N-acetyltransferase [Lachnospiraceae bacterium]|jgi:ribosomal-protein-alanine N-acetyltransferase|nr:GNAT family N-acetyltransferase [Lachnospiraceae bacterium]